MRRAAPGASMIDAIIVGGGLAGAATATLLASAGREVVVLEREHGPHDKVCGEFLSREASLYLGALGIDLAALGAVPIDTVRMTCRTISAVVPLPFPALSLSRRVLDEALLVRAAAAGATIRRGARVAELMPAADGYRARLTDHETVTARTAFLATGKHDLRGWKRPPGLQHDLVAFKLHFRLEAEQTRLLERHVELSLFEGGYAGLSLIEGGRANLCLVVRRGRFAALGQRWDRLLGAIREQSPQLDERLCGAVAASDRPLALSSIPYGYVRRSAAGPFFLGDQAAVIPSFSGDGMSIALHSAELAAQAYLAGDASEVLARQLARDVGGQVLLATVLSQGLVRGPSQAAFAAMARRFPRVLASVAGRTRISDEALARTGAGARSRLGTKQPD